MKPFKLMSTFNLRGQRSEETNDSSTLLAQSSRQLPLTPAFHRFPVPCPRIGAVRTLWKIFQSSSYPLPASWVNRVSAHLLTNNQAKKARRTGLSAKGMHRNKKSKANKTKCFGFLRPSYGRYGTVDLETSRDRFVGSNPTEASCWWWVSSCSFSGESQDETW